MSRPRALICDFGGVLTTPLIESFAAYQEQSGVAMEELGAAMARLAERDGGHPLHALERGEITEADFLGRLESELGGAGLRSFRETYFAHLRPNEPMIDYVRAVRARGVRMALLTNNVREWEPHWRSKLPDVDDVFEVVVDSAFVGMRKPDPEIYELTVERLGDGLAPGDCVFVDDTLPNVDTARALGMQAVHFLDNEQAIAELEEALARELA